MVLGAIAERLRQSAIVGYLFAGMVVGPSLLGWVPDREQIFSIAELGVALLLFTIGLEFSPRRVLNLGRIPLIVGSQQVVFTLMLGMVGGLLIGRPLMESIVIGAMVTLSSTACALRLLTDRAEVDSLHGRTALGVPLVQDVAVVPLMLIITALSERGTLSGMLSQLTVSLVLAVGLIAAFYGIFNYIMPRILTLSTWRRNRDLPILLATVMAVGSAWTAHSLGLSPSLGAFVAGVMLAVSPFATPIRADIFSLKTVMVTLFYAAVGLFADVAWLLQNLPLVGAVVLALVMSKTALVTGLAWLAGHPFGVAIATGLSLAQVGEFSFVPATIAHNGSSPETILPELSFRVLVSATIITLFSTPYHVAVEPHAGSSLQRFATPCDRTSGLSELD